MAEDDDWGGEGFAGAQEKVKEWNGPRVPRRWYLPVGESGELTFVTDLPFTYHEHNLKLDGHWRNWFTCLGKGCPMCKAGNEPYLAGAWLVVEHNEWTDKEGNVHVDEPRLFIAKPNVVVKIQRKRDDPKHGNGSMIGVRLNAAREGRQSANTGDSFDFVSKLTEQKIKSTKWWPTKELGVVDKAKWREWLARKTPDQLREVLAGAAEEGGDDDDNSGDRPVRF